ncbi:MAG: ribosome biogenesis GTPase Der [Actinobacteria bacterium]|nr:ribosome biogenesis GTPase Der [Actinomycetota bacterium]
MTEPRTGSRPKVAIIGRPNVGKSTLVNRLAARRGSIVGPVEGMTRDRVDTEVSWGGRTFTVSDTGGLLESAMRTTDEGITGKVAAKAVAALNDCDLVLFVVDAEVGITSDEVALADRLRRVDKPLILVANKVDSERDEANVTEMWSLGLGEPMVVSAIHGRGSGDLLDRIVDALPETLDNDEEVPIPSIALVGRPNVGKSSIFNKIVGEERAIVHHEPGTTRDSIDTIVELDGRFFRFIDTAGIRRRAKTQGVEIYSASRTRDAIERADVAVLVVDAAEGATSQDQRIAKQVEEAGVAAIVALNKWDLIKDPDLVETAERSMADRLHFVDYAPMVRTSARTQRGIKRLIGQLDEVLAARTLRVPTSRLNQVIQEAQQRAPAPRSSGRNSRVLYATQASTAPPTFVMFASGGPNITWLRYIERRLRETFGFTGNPIRLVWREKERRYASSRRG